MSTVLSSESQSLCSLVVPPTTYKVTSVLERKRKLYGPQNMFSEDPTTCWNSDQGPGQQITLNFHRCVSISSISMLFQGGFVGQDIELYILPYKKDELEQVENPTWEYVDIDIDPEDTNDLQTFDCKLSNISAMRLKFGRSTDFYGRIIIYQFKILGHNM